MPPLLFLLPPALRVNAATAWTQHFAWKPITPAHHSSSVGQALTLHYNSLPANDKLTPETLPGAKLKILSAAINKATFKRRRAAECPANQATLLSECGKGALEF